MYISECCLDLLYLLTGKVRGHSRSGCQASSIPICYKLLGHVNYWDHRSSNVGALIVRMLLVLDERSIAF